MQPSRHNPDDRHTHIHTHRQTNRMVGEKHIPFFKGIINENKDCKIKNEIGRERERERDRERDREREIERERGRER